MTRKMYLSLFTLMCIIHIYKLKEKKVLGQIAQFRVSCKIVLNEMNINKTKIRINIWIYKQNEVYISCGQLIRSIEYTSLFCFNLSCKVILIKQYKSSLYIYIYMYILLFALSSSMMHFVLNILFIILQINK